MNYKQRSTGNKPSEMSKELTEIKIGFQGLQTLYQTYLPKVDPVLINDLLSRLQEENPNTSPFYVVEIFTKPATDSETVSEHIWNITGMMPATIYDNAYGKDPIFAKTRYQF